MLKVPNNLEPMSPSFNAVEASLAALRHGSLAADASAVAVIIRTLPSIKGTKDSSKGTS